MTPIPYVTVKGVRLKGVRVRFTPQMFVTLELAATGVKVFSGRHTSWVIKTLLELGCLREVGPSAYVITEEGQKMQKKIERLKRPKAKKLVAK